MFSIDVQTLTLVEAGLLLVTNGVGVALTLLAWHVSDVDVREALAWTPSHPDPVERRRLKHNRKVVTMDLRYGEIRRLQAHLIVGLVGLFWLWTPQPVNPAVVWWAVAIRAAVILLSLLLIDKTIHHLIARWRFDRPSSTQASLRDLWPALALAWRDMRSRNEARS